MDLCGAGSLPASGHGPGRICRRVLHEMEPELSSGSASDSGFAGDGWKIDITMDGGNYSEVSVYAEDTETFLSLSVMTGLTVAEGYANDLYEYLGKVLLMYLRGRAGEEAAPYSFLDHYVFQMTKQGDGYLFTLQVV